MVITPEVGIHPHSKVEPRVPICYPLVIKHGNRKPVMFRWNSVHTWIVVGFPRQPGLTPWGHISTHEYPIVQISHGDLLSIHHHQWLINIQSDAASSGGCHGSPGLPRAGSWSRMVYRKAAALTHGTIISDVKLHSYDIKHSLYQLSQLMYSESVL